MFKYNLTKEVSYLRHAVTREEVKPNTDKIDAITKFPVLKKKLKAF